jgi:type II secretory pathway pseudopilin PulG
MQLRLFKTLKMNNAIETTTTQPGNGISVRQGRTLHHQPVGRSSSGFTLIEAAVAMLVTTVGLVAVAGSFAVAVKTNANSQNMTTATTFAQDKLEQLETATFQTLADPSKMSTNPNAPNSQYALIAGSLDQDIMTADGTYYYDKIILAGPGDIQPEGTITVVRPDGTAETRRPDGTVFESNPFPPDRFSYMRRWAVMSSTEPNTADRRLTIGVRVKSAKVTAGKAPEEVDLYTVLTNS